jgi:large subunit ribosomal protein L15
MNLNDAKSVSVNRKRSFRVGRGRGSGWGKTSRRGQKGASSRAGWGGGIMREGGQMSLVRRLPKKGFNNSIFRVRYEVVNLDRLSLAATGGEVTPDSLKEAGLIKRSARWVKVLGNGEVGAALHVSAHHFSKGAREKIEKAGGSVTVLAGRHGRAAEPSKGERHAALAAARTVKLVAARAAGELKAKAAEKEAGDAEAAKGAKAPKVAKPGKEAGARPGKDAKHPGGKPDAQKPAGKKKPKDE